MRRPWQVWWRYWEWRITGRIKTNERKDFECYRDTGYWPWEGGGD